MKVRNFEIFELHADTCRVLAHSKRLAILACLDRKELSVGELAEILDTPLSTVSRHLGELKGKNLVVSRQEGHRVYYRPADPRIIQACQLIRKVLIDGMKRRDDVAQEYDPDDIIVGD